MIDLKSGKRLFWILQLSGWLLYLAFILITYWARGGLTKEVLAGYPVNISISFLVSLGLRLFFRRMRIRDESVLYLSSRVFILAFLAGHLTLWISILIENSFFGPEGFGPALSLRTYLAAYVSWTVPLIGWSALYFGIKFWQEWMIQKEKAEKAYALAQTAQLQMLRYRMNPHFLFNTLNSIRALISEDKASAKSMVTELSEYLRYSLVSRNFANVPFKEEVEAVRHYFVIQKMRYENKLEVAFEIDPAVEEYPVASFLLHPLAENAVKYGMASSPLPLKIQIRAALCQGNLQVDVINSGSWVESADQEGDAAIGKGLDNVRRRLADGYPGKHRFEILEKDRFVHVRLTLGKNDRS